uniref:ODAD1 central coiled coil region domain-containing protein n=1 Tax=Chromera velia CCMP2878 TaxID=1169474 RepID=A0A0G4FF30_9ALVE|eukprot:Cvel_16620.t1-p1 / transcript=Cvel_16620.t1 / gene=Cvel_16620 / organism=Chromera_velia_CCMP2878 / gene_product=Outer dynein arm protein 1, putative / transcript_product=Outer dynein arm protein 1, putative / location=Cvel_scaffold1288:6628-12139(+) / protein_length=585 / sequence_SO=supercontig / SO=protein_coding / is_pseudo=false
MELAPSVSTSSPPPRTPKTPRTPGGSPRGVSMTPRALQNYLDDHVQRMQQEIEMVTRKLELEKRRRHILEESVQRTQDEYNDKRLKYNLTQASDADDVRKAYVQIRLMENRLEKALSKLNNTINVNNQLRSTVDQHRRETLTLAGVFHRLRYDIETNSKQLDYLKVQQGESKKVQQEAGKRFNSLNKTLGTERDKYKTTETELKQEMKDADMRMKEMEIKVHKETVAQRAGGGAFLVTEEEQGFNQEEMMRRILKICFLNSIQYRHIREQQRAIEVFEEAFATIKSTTGISDIEEIVKIFVKLEERNFSLLTFVNQVNREIEAVEARTKELKGQIAAHESTEREAEKRKALALREVQHQIETVRAATEEKERVHLRSQATLEKCRPHVESLRDWVANEWPEGLSNDLVGPAEDDGFLPHLQYIERFVLQFKDYIPSMEEVPLYPESYSPSNKSPKAGGPLPSQTVQLLNKAAQQQQQKMGSPRAAMLKPSEIPSSNIDDSDGDDAELGHTPYDRKKLREKSLESLKQRKKAQRGAAQQAPGPAVGASQASAVMGQAPPAASPWGARGPSSGGGGGSRGKDSSEPE